MKTKNLYYATVFGRTNVIKEMILRFFIMIASWPRLLLEVFVRKNMGERYFSLSTAVIMTIILAFVPYQISNSFFNYGSLSFWEYVRINPSWYLFLAAFSYFSWKRYLEVKREPGVFDFAKFSLYTGEKMAQFYDVKLLGIKPTSRIVATIYEPALFFAIGTLLSICHQSIGQLICMCAICYSLGYAGQYHLGDMFVMDKIDEMICNEELVESFVNNREPNQTRGFEAYGKRPADDEFRRKVYDQFFDHEEEASEAY